MSEQFKIYIHSPKHHISEQTIRKFINSVNMIANNLFDGNVYNFDKVIDYMTEIDYLKHKINDMEKAFDKLHKRHMILLKEQGELERYIDEQQSRIKKLEEEKVELMEDCACQYKQIQKLESENEELEMRIFQLQQSEQLII